MTSTIDRGGTTATITFSRCQGGSWRRRHWSADLGEPLHTRPGITRRQRLDDHIGGIIAGPLHLRIVPELWGRFTMLQQPIPL